MRHQIRLLKSASALNFWEKMNYQDYFTREAGVDFLSGASLHAHMNVAPEYLTRELGELRLNILGQGTERGYSWKTAVWGTAMLQRQLTNDDYRKILILIADQAAANDAVHYGKKAMTAEFWLALAVNQLGRTKKSGGNPLIYYLAFVMENDVMRGALNPKSEFTKFWKAIVMGKNDAALAAIHNVPDSRLQMLTNWHAAVNLMKLTGQIK